MGGGTAGPTGRRGQVQLARRVAGAASRPAIDHLVVETDDPVLGRVPLVGPPVRIAVEPGERRPGRRHGGEQGALGGHRIIDLSSFWAGPLASRLLAELGADVVKVEPPGGEGGFQMMPVLPNIYVDANRSKRGIVLDLKTPEDRVRLLDLVAASDVVVENAMAGAWERLGLDEDALRAVNPGLVYARAKGFGVAGPLASRPSFDYVVQAATGMEMTQGGGGGRCRSTSPPTTTGRGCCWGRASCWPCWDVRWAWR